MWVSVALNIGLLVTNLYESDNDYFEEVTACERYIIVVQDG